MNIVPSILTGSYKELHHQVELVKSSVEWVQLDVADGKFVDTITVGLKDIPDGEFAGLAVEAHLMVEDPISYLDDCERLQVNRVIVHSEVSQDLGNIISQIVSRKMQVSLALNPKTKVTVIDKYIETLDAVLLMSVQPGRQGQKFIPDILEKISQVRIIEPDIIIGLDGGVNLKNIEKISAYRPDYVIVGSLLWKSTDPNKMLETLRKKVQRDLIR